MILSAPIFRLKRNARNLARRKKIALNLALDRIAVDEGFRSWGHLVSTLRAHRPETSVIAELEPGELLLIAARPGHGKTVFGLQLLAEASSRKCRSVFLSSEFSESGMRQSARDFGFEKLLGTGIELNFRDDLRADVVMDGLSGAPRGTVAVVDYLQVLDQRRTAPELSDQIEALKRFASDSGTRLIFLSQVHPAFESSDKRLPALADVRLPNPVDLSLFDKGCFLHSGEMAFHPI
ncbi:DNA helicase [Roseibium sp. MMSF_3544]|uniref:DNA helicase n=1 Tax=unclassified Roseibium TaxID=2629323 RepID=UPI00273D0268|nr:DNA helicase [Roseibium sp. MMSF_3544]